MMIGYFYNNILPGRAGEAARIVVLNRRGDTPAAEIVGTVILERLYDIVAILVIFFAAEPWLPHVSWVGTAALAALALAVLIVAAATVLVIYGDRAVWTLLRPLRRIRWLSPARLSRTAAELSYGLSGLRHVAVAAEAFVWTLIAWLLSGASAYILIVAFHLHLPFTCGLLVVVGVGLGMILPSPPAALGVFEGAALIALRIYGISRSDALPYALVLHAVSFIPFIAIGVLLLHHNSRRPAAGWVDQVSRVDEASAPACSASEVPRSSSEQAIG